MIFHSPPSLALPKEYLEFLDKHNINYQIVERLEDVAPTLDVVYATRIQKERFILPVEYERVKNAYSLDRDFARKLKPTCRIMHPLPRINELNKNLDSAEQAVYFEQAHNGVFVRQALLALVLGAL